MAAPDIGPGLRTAVSVRSSPGRRGEEGGPRSAALAPPSWDERCPFGAPDTVRGGHPAHVMCINVRTRWSAAHSAFADGRRAGLQPLKWGPGTERPAFAGLS